MKYTAQKDLMMSRQLWLVLFGLTLTDFFLTTNLIALNGLEAEANPFMRMLFGIDLFVSSALLYKLFSFTFLYFVLTLCINEIRSKNVILSALVFIYTIIVVYSLGLTYL